MPNARTEQLNEWEQSRRREVSMDVRSHWQRSLPGVAIAVAAWAGVDYLGLASADMWKFAIALLAVVHITGRVIVWLRLWGSFAERRLTEIEALVGNGSPADYTSGDLVDFERNPLFAKLDDLERAVDRLEANA